MAEADPTRPLRFVLPRLARLFQAGRELPRAVRLIHAATGYRSLGWLGTLTLAGLLPAATVQLTRWIIDALVAALGDGGTTGALSATFLPIGLMVAVIVTRELLTVVSRRLDAVLSELLEDHVLTLVHDRSASADLAFYERPESFDRLHRARDEASYRPMALLRNFGGLWQGGVTFAAMIAVLAPYGLWLPLALFVSTLPAFAVALHFTIDEYDWRMKRTVDERRSWHYDWLLTSRETASELRLFGLAAHFGEAWRSLNALLRREHLDLVRRRSLAELTARLAGLAVTAVAVSWMLRRAAAGAGTVGDVVLFYQAFGYGQSILRTLLAEVSAIYANTLFLGNLFRFLDLEPTIVDPSHPEALPERRAREVRFEGVRFSYPGSSRAALDGFDLTIEPGTTVALVGANGAGKSTILKLLCRLYDPDEGCVRIDGIDVRRLELAALRRQITVLFQEPVRYGDTAGRNIAFGDLASSPSAERIRAAARYSGAAETIARLPSGYDQVLGKWLPGGTDLSFGEWQRLALARACLRPAPILLLDEPTSAMDSWAEAEWHDRFRALASGRTVIVITHRFTTAARADRIHVVDAGRIVESGTHAELAAAGGSYARAWSAQIPAGEPGRDSSGSSSPPSA